MLGLETQLIGVSWGQPLISSQVLSPLGIYFYKPIVTSSLLFIHIAFEIALVDYGLLKEGFPITRTADKSLCPDPPSPQSLSSKLHSGPQRGLNSECNYKKNCSDISICIANVITVPRVTFPPLLEQGQCKFHKSKR